MQGVMRCLGNRHEKYVAMMGLHSHLHARARCLHDELMGSHDAAGHFDGPDRGLPSGGRPPWRRPRPPVPRRLVSLLRVVLDQGPPDKAARLAR